VLYKNVKINEHVIFDFDLLSLASARVRTETIETALSFLLETDVGFESMKTKIKF